MRQTTRRTRELASVSDTEMPAPMTYLRGEHGLDSLDSYPSADSFILDTALQLEEAPVANPVVHSLATPLASDALEVFHHYLVACITSSDNLLADIMVNPGHITSFPTGQLLEKPLSRPCAFGLKNRTQMLELALGSLDPRGVEEPVVRCDNQVPYSEVEAKNSMLRARAFDLNLFGKAEQEEASSFSIEPEQGFINIPTHILPVAVRDIELELGSALEQPERQGIASQPCAAWEVVSDAGLIDDGLALGLLGHPASLLDAPDCKLRWQLVLLPECGIDNSVQIEVGLDAYLPSLVHTELQGFGVSSEGSDNLRVGSNLNFDGGSCSHISQESNLIYITCGDEWAIHPTFKKVGILAHAL